MLSTALARRWSARLLTRGSSGWRMSRTDSSRTTRRRTGYPTTSGTAASTTGWRTLATGLFRYEFPWVSAGDTTNTRVGQRDRFWGTPIPLWVSDDGEEVVCIGSIEQLQELSGRTDITDLHRENIDDIVIPSKQGKGDLKRVTQVFDCWFESGSMPYAQRHYPFEDKVPEGLAHE